MAGSFVTKQDSKRKKKSKKKRSSTSANRYQLLSGIHICFSLTSVAIIWFLISIAIFKERKESTIELVLAGF
jgi:hypothetical protein